jgi:hypothetical protein
MRQLILVLTKPWACGDGPTAFRSRSAWFGPFALIALIRLVLTAATHRAVAAAVALQLPPGADDVDRVVAAAQLDRELPAQLMFLPVRDFAGFAVVAVVTALLVRLWKPPRPLLFTQVLALVIAAQGAFLAGELIRAGSLLAGPANDFLMPLGLDRIVAPWARPSALPLFNAINLFAVWYVSALALSLAALTGMSRMTCAAIAVQVWGAVTFFQLLVMTAVRVAMHMPV